MLCRRHVEAEQREDLRFGVLASLLANIHRDPKRHRKPYTPHDFFPSLPRPQPRRQSAEAMESSVLAFVRGKRR